MNFKNLKNFVYNIVYMLTSANKRFSSKRIVIAQNAGIGDAIIYLNSLNRAVSPYNISCYYYINPSYIHLLEPLCASKIYLKSIYKLNAKYAFLNLSPHTIIGGSTDFLFRQIYKYILRSFAKLMHIYVYNEYQIAFSVCKFIVEKIDLSSCDSNNASTSLLICPESKDWRKSLLEFEIKKIIKYVKKRKSVSSIYIISNRTDLHIPNTKKVYFTQAHKYLALKFDFAFCADSWLAHFFAAKGKRVFVVVKDRQYKTFLPIVPVININKININ